MKLYRIKKSISNLVPVRRHNYYLKLSHAARYTWNSSGGLYVQAPLGVALSLIEDIKKFEDSEWDFEAVG